MFLSTLSFFLANVFVKQVAHIPAMETVFFRCIVATVFCVWGLRRAKASLIGSNHLMLLLRGMFGTTALYFFFVTLQQMPIASAQTIQYLSPIFTATIAIFVLKEAVRPTQWFFYAIAFSGVLLIEQFDSRIELKYLIFGIISAFCSGMAYNLVRSLCDLARTQKRVIATEQETDNEKYAFRCFLLRLGFIGTEYKEARKILLKNLSGNAAFRTAREAGDKE